jgi:flagellar basal body-associated protein FliL
MRNLVALLLAVVMLLGVPWLWQRAMVAEVNRVANEEPVFVASEPITTNFNSAEIGNITITPPLEINTEEYEALAVQSYADQAMRQAQAAQDQAWAATH